MKRQLGPPLYLADTQTTQRLQSQGGLGQQIASNNNPSPSQGSKQKIGRRGNGSLQAIMQLRPDGAGQAPKRGTTGAQNLARGA